MVKEVHVYDHDTAKAVRQRGALDALNAFLEAVEDMARDDIDGDAGKVSYAELRAGIRRAIEIVADEEVI